MPLISLTHGKHDHLDHNVTSNLKSFYVKQLFSLPPKPYILHAFYTLQRCLNYSCLSEPFYHWNSKMYADSHIKRSSVTEVRLSDFSWFKLKFQNTLAKVAPWLFPDCGKLGKCVSVLRKELPCPRYDAVKPATSLNINTVQVLKSCNSA